MTIYNTREGVRLRMNEQRLGHWNRWGPFLAERAWGTVREDYSADGDAWRYFPHDHARSRAYRWNEDGIAGICDRHQYICFALAFWNGKDPYLKERLFGLTGHEGNHGEDVKECYFYVDNTPTHSYMKYVYRYPQAAFPYDQLLQESLRRSRHDPEFELTDTGIFNEDRYFDIVVEYAKHDAEDILIRISITNRGPEAAPLHILPTLWFRNTWTWGRDPRRPLIRKLASPPPLLPGEGRGEGALSPPPHHMLIANHYALGEHILYAADADGLLFTDNETNYQRVFNSPNPTPHVKDGFHAYIVDGDATAISTDELGTKAAVHYVRDIAPGQTATLTLRLAALVGDHPLEFPFADFDANLDQRREEADEFYSVVFNNHLPPESQHVARQAFAGMLWSKQYYHFVVNDWLKGDPGEPAPPANRRDARNHEWRHLFARDVISMPDKWEFPWFASWDLAFHCAAIAHVDPQFAKDQIILMMREWYMHPNGQLPAYEWDFGDVNPPVLAPAARAVFDIERAHTGNADYVFLERVFAKTVLNFTWWVNRKDPHGNNVFQGGFLGMDNIGAFDRGKLPPGYMLGQADGTSWMAAFARSMLMIAMILAERNPVYEDLASKFWEHFIYIANSMNSMSDPSKSLWHEQDGFFYDHLTTPTGEVIPIRARTMVGFVPLFGATVVDAKVCDRHAAFDRRRQWFITHRPDLIAAVGPMVTPGVHNTLILGLVRTDQLRRMLAYMLDENEFLSPYGIRSVSKYHAEHPLIMRIEGQEYRLDYEPGESQTDLFGGNSNWRGPIWMPVNFLIIQALREYHLYYGNQFQVECPTGSGNMMTLEEVAKEISRRVTHIFLRDGDGKRPVFGDCDLFNNDPHWRDYIPFYEYFHGDTGRGCGASHQTGWTGLIAQIMFMLGKDTA
jgi:hypothetical protein